MNMWQAVRSNIKRTTVAAALGLSAGAAAFAQPTLPQTVDFESTPVTGSTVATITVDNIVYTSDAADLEIFNGVGASGSRALLTFGFGTEMTVAADDGSAFAIDSFYYDPCQAYYQIASVTATLSGGGTFTKSSGFPARGSTSLTGACNEGEGATVTLSEPQFDDVTQIRIVVNYDDGGFSGDFMLGAFDNFAFSAVAAAPTVALSGGGSVSEATSTRTVTATLSAPASTDTTVNLAYSGTATGSGTDYSAATSITILAGNTTGTTNITVANDNTVEADETVIVDISSVSGGDGATEDGTQQQTFTITNDDTATVTIADVSGDENGGPITVTLTLDNAVDGGFDVDVSSVNGTAIAPGDFIAVTNATETFAGTAGETETFTITPVGDTTPEPNETPTISMGNLTPTTVSTGAFDISDTATVTINNDDSINASVNDPSVSENTGTLTFTVSLDSAALTGGATVDYATSNGTAVAGADYTATSGTVTFAAGESSKTIDVTITGDTTVEADESLTLTLSNPTGTGITIGDATGTGTITNDDSASVTIADVAVNENDGTATVTLTLDNAVDGGFDVNVSTADGTATTADSDYTAVVGATETFAGTAGETETFTITLGGDTKVEADETISVSMSGLVPVTVSGGDITITDTATVTLTNDDSATLTIADVTQAEGGTFNLVVTLDSAVDGGFTVDVATSDGTATAGSDYTALVSETLTFSGTASETQSVTLTVADDAVVELDETLTVTLANVVAGTVDAADIDDSDGATVTITNNDAPVVFLSAINPNPLAEANQAATIEVTQSVAALEDTLVTLALSGTATGGGVDYTLASTSVTILAGSTSGTTTLTAVQDSLYEPASETVIVDIDGISGGNGATESGVQQRTISILEDDSEPTLSIADVAVSEADGTATFTVSLSNATTQTVTVNYAASDGTATAGSDYTTASGTLTFMPGDLSETFAVAISDDGVVEPNEAFSVDLTSPTNATLADATADATITDDDSAPSIVSVSVPSNTTYVAGQDLDFVVTFSEAVNVVGTPQLSLTVGASSVTADYAGGTGTTALTFTYTVQTGDEDTDGVVVSSPLVVGGGSIQDGDGNDAGLVLNSVASTAGVLVDAIAPSAPSVPDLDASSDLGSSDSDDITSDDMPTLSGTAEANASVEIFSSLDGSLGTTTANGAGDWSFTPGTAISEGEHEFTAEASDAAGNTSPASGGLTVTIDVTAPTLDSVDLFAGTVSPTDADVVSFQAVFSEDLDLTTISGADFVSTGTTATPTSSSVSNSEFEISLAGGDMADLNATVTVALAASPTILDIAGNALVDTAVQGTNNNSVDVLNDTTPPDVSITTASADPVSGAFSITIEFTESVTGFVVGDIIVGNGSASNFAGSGDTYTADITPTVDGTVTVDVAAGVAQDAAGNDNTAATQFSIESDGTAPGVIIDSVASSPVSGPFRVTITFDEQVSGFTSGDVVIGNGSVLNFNDAGGGLFQVDILPSADGTVTVDVAAGVAQDAAGNDNTAATQFSIESDGTAPGVTITTASADPVSGTFAVTFAFDEAVTGFVVGDITVGNGAASNFSGSGDTYTADITPTADGTVTVDVAAGVAQDAAGNDNTAATQFSIESDGTAPGVVISTASSDPVSGTFSVTFTFDEAVTGFAVGDITVGNGSAGNFAGSGDTYTADITPSADGTVTVDVAAGVAQDAAGNDNTVAAQFSIEVDSSAPEVVIASAAVGPVNAAFSITVDFTEAVTGFELADLIVSNGTASNFAGSGDSYTADITPTADGFVAVEVLDGVAQDAAGNDNAASEEPFSIEFDGTEPELSITTVSSEVSGPFEATFTFTEAVTGFEIADIIVDNGVASSLSGAGAVYTATITPDAPGPLVIDAAAGAAVDAAGNDNVAGETSVEVVTQAPTVSLVLSSLIANPGDVAGTATLSNPGSNPLPFSALADVSWVDVTPGSGTIPGLADLDLTIALNDEVNALEPGLYTGNVTVTLGTADASPTASNATTQSTVTQLDIPIELTVEERFGTVELVATTPAGGFGRFQLWLHFRSGRV